MKILITGCSGFVGRNLIKLLSQEKNIHIYGCDKTLYGLATRIDKFFFCDYHFLPRFEELMKDEFDYLIHLAAYVKAGDSFKDEFECYSTNLYRIPELLKLKFKRSIWFSSAAVKFRLNPYGHSKYHMENLLEYSLPPNSYKIIRPENIFGPYQNPFYGAVILNFIKSIINNENINIFGNGEQKRDFIHVDLICKTILQLIKDDKFWKSTEDKFGIGTGKPISVNTIAESLIKLSGKKDVKTVYSESRQGDVDCSFSEDMIVEQDLDSYLKQTLNFYQSNYGSPDKSRL